MMKRISVGIVLFLMAASGLASENAEQKLSLHFEIPGTSSARIDLGDSPVTVSNFEKIDSQGISYPKSKSGAISQYTFNEAVGYEITILPVDDGALVKISLTKLDKFAEVSMSGNKINIPITSKCSEDVLLTSKNGFSSSTHDCGIKIQVESN